VSVVPDSDRDERSAQLVTTLGAVRARIADACIAAGRDAQSVTLIAVTKTYPASDVATLARLGVQDVGESKDQEARAKLAELSALPIDLRWHLVGRLQTNKARSVASYAAAVHSVDRVKLARALADAAAEQRADPLDVFLQVSLDGDPDRGGVAAGEVPALADAVADRTELQLRGLMAVPPIDADADAAFARLRDLSVALQVDHPDAVSISAGMSADLEAAVRNGSTHVRVGSALLGRRGPIFS
jgi:pyridoxal phosphate enzyme (YggS family)